MGWNDRTQITSWGGMFYHTIAWGGSDLAHSMMGWNDHTPGLLWGGNQLTTQ